MNVKLKLGKSVKKNIVSSVWFLVNDSMRYSVYRLVCNSLYEPIRSSLYKPINNKSEWKI